MAMQLLKHVHYAAAGLDATNVSRAVIAICSPKGCDMVGFGDDIIKRLYLLSKLP